jgi:hypothetical protein
MSHYFTCKPDYSFTLILSGLRPIEFRQFPDPKSLISKYLSGFLKSKNIAIISKASGYFNSFRRHIHTSGVYQALVYSILLFKSNTLSISKKVNSYNF